jgi:probable O-glycosylation ligase (exosortase A-associated)
MPLTTLTWISAYIAGIILAFIHPIYGLFTYFMTYYAHPPLRWWGKHLPDYRWSLIISIITLAAFLLRKNSLPKLSIKKHPQTKWLIFFLLNTLVVSTRAVWVEENRELVEIIIKYTLLYLIIVQTIRTKEHFRYMMIFHIIGIFDWGWNAYVDPQRRAGRLFGIGGPDSLNDNGTASHLLAIMPFMGSVFFTGKRWEKLLCIAALPFVFNTFILANSRGAFVALIVTGSAGLLITKGTMRWKTIGAMLIAGLVFYNLIDEKFVQRQQTIQTYEEDNASMERIESWKAAFHLIRDHPLGTGGGGFEALSPIYIPDIVEAHEGEVRNVHNTFLLVASEWGIQGFMLFMAFILSTLWGLLKIRQEAPQTPDGERVRLDSIALILGIVGVLSAGFFFNRLYAESVYWLAAFAAVLRNIHAQVAEAAIEDPQTHDCPPAPDHVPALPYAGSSSR